MRAEVIFYVIVISHMNNGDKNRAHCLMRLFDLAHMVHLSRRLHARYCTNRLVVVIAGMIP